MYSDVCTRRSACTPTSTDIFVLTAGVTAILVQFPIDHFRSIGWYNVILGVLYIFLQFAMFRGESKCRYKDVRQKCGCTLPEISNWKQKMTVNNVVVILISLTC